MNDTRLSRMQAMKKRKEKRLDRFVAGSLLVGAAGGAFIAKKVGLQPIVGAMLGPLVTVNFMKKTVDGLMGELDELNNEIKEELERIDSRSRSCAR